MSLTTIRLNFHFFKICFHRHPDYITNLNTPIGDSMISDASIVNKNKDRTNKEKWCVLFILSVRLNKLVLLGVWVVRVVIITN